MNTQSTQFILASSSKYRAKLLKRIIPNFKQLSPNVDETRYVEESAIELAKRLAAEKANAIALQHPNSWILGSDQVAEVEGLLLEKPGNFERAKEQLLCCSQKTVNFISAVSIQKLDCHYICTDINCVSASFRTLTEQQIENYLKIEQPFDCAGSFKVESLGITLFEKIESSDPTSLEGLPLILLSQMLRAAGIEPLVLVGAR